MQNHKIIKFKLNKKLLTIFVIFFAVFTLIMFGGSIVQTTLNSNIFKTNNFKKDTCFNIANNPNFQSQELYNYDGEIFTLSFNTLMAFPEKALSDNNNLSSSFDENKITTSEFKNILYELYKNNYVLISINQLIDSKTLEQIPLKLPKNKKPILLVFDNVSYKSNYQNLGEIDKIIIDRNNNLATYTTKKSIQDRVAYDNEFILILENFIKQFPDFSFNGAKGVIFLTGEHGILGYNTNHKNASSKYESKRVSEVIKKLKSLGWQFGCNNYSYKLDSNLNDMEFAKDLSLWNSEVSPLIGTTNLYAYPYGENDENSNKQELLITSGFKIFFECGEPSSNQKISDTYHFYYYKINGKTLRENYQVLDNLFSCEKVYDYDYRTVPFKALIKNKKRYWQ